MSNKEDAQEHLDKIKECMYELDTIFRQSGDHMLYERFKSYPKGHIAMALDDDHDYLGKGMFTIQKLINSMDDDGDSDEDSDEDEHERDVRLSSEDKE